LERKRNGGRKQKKGRSRPLLGQKEKANNNGRPEELEITLLSKMEGTGKRKALVTTSQKGSGTLFKKERRPKDKRRLFNRKGTAGEGGGKKAF